MRKRDRPKDTRGGHIRLYWDLFDSPAWRAMSNADQKVWLAMRRRLGATNNGDIEAVLSDMRHAGIRSSSTLAKALRALEVLGFIAKIRQGMIANGGNICSLYRFCDEPTLDIARINVQRAPASNEWREIRTIGEAKAILRDAHEAAKRPQHRNAGKVRNAKRTTSKIEAGGEDRDSIVEHRQSDPIRKSKQAAAGQKVPKAVPARALRAVSGVASPSDAPASKIEVPYKLPSVGATKRRGRKRSTHVTLDGREVPRVLAGHVCEAAMCQAQIGEPHAKGCRLEPCPVCSSPSWPKCQCGHDGKQFRFLDAKPRRKASANHGWHGDGDVQRH